MIINYIRDKSKRPNGIVVATDKDKIGWSLLNRKDAWNKELGIKIALNRANTDINWIDRIKHKPNKPRLYKDLLPILERMKKRSEKYNFIEGNL